jgi:hypothetical protein
MFDYTQYYENSWRVEGDTIPSENYNRNEKLGKIADWLGILDKSKSKDLKGKYFF